MRGTHGKRPGGGQVPAIVAWLCINLLLGAGARSQTAAPAALVPPTPTSSGHFRVAVETAQPVTINRMYTWIVSVEDSGGRAALEAEIGVDGGVPGLQRHLPTAPRMTSALGGGKYRIDGVKFDMAGLWRLRLDVRAGGVADAVMFDVVVRP